MKKYLIKIGSNSDYGMEFYSNSCNSKKHILENYGSSCGAWCNVYTLSGKQISAAVSNNGKIFNVIFY